MEKDLLQQFYNSKNNPKPVDVSVDRATSEVVDRNSMSSDVAILDVTPPRTVGTSVMYPVKVWGVYKTDLK